MYDWASFDTVFAIKTDYCLDPKQVEAIARERRDFKGTLFFDRIAASIGLKQPHKLYPPKSNADLRTLWDNITSSAVADEKKQAVLLYVLRDCVAGSGSKLLPQIDTKFARKSFLPPKYRTLISGLWELDHAHFAQALTHLTDPMLTAEFADDVLITLERNPRCDEALAMGYYITVLPPLVKQDALEAYIRLLVKTNVVEAYRFASKQEQEKHRMLFEIITSYIHDEDDADIRSVRATTFLSLPFTNLEEQWFEEYLTYGAGAELPNAKDSVIMHRLAMGRGIDDVGKLSRHRGTKVDGIDWTDIRKLHQTAPVAASAE